ncbi:MULTISPECIES: AMP-binding protein [unclassified Vibrio]|uniref:AMP-binding protein n=1 Tax=Vibrio sp. HB236076 TaxID=3232307 RepID=A0AB39HB85_9VIBR|nr:AMP-binding protein [Vibrio sp. HB161653]MDP5253795.1 AMP-binding protein [Vibrio sp. HB161653]
MTITLSPLQMAYWSGRQATGIAAHFYTEWRIQDLDLTALKRSVMHLYLMHPCLRLSISSQGQAQVMPFSPEHWHRLHIIDGQHWSDSEVAAQIAHIRHQKMHQTLALEQGQAVEFTVTLLPNGQAQFHLDVEMLAVDGSSVCRLMTQLAERYTYPLRQPPQEDNTLSVLSESHSHRQSTKAYQQAQNWWQQQLNNIAPAPELPEPVNQGKHDLGHTERWSTMLDPHRLRALEQLANQHQVTMSTLCLTMFQLLLSHQCQQPRLRLMVPSFYRPWAVNGDQPAIGDFSDVSVFSGHTQSSLTLLEHVKCNAETVAELLSHRAYSGVEVMRDLSRYRGTVAQAPVVFTSGWSEQDTLFTKRVQEVFGGMQWASSQGAYVFLDAQFAPCQQGLLINWDVRLDRVERQWVEASFTAMASLLNTLASEPSYWQQPWQTVCQHLFPSAQGDKIRTEPPTSRQEEDPALLRTPFTGLQQTYLLGREASTSLGGVAMHDTRLYRGNWDSTRWQTNLALAIEQCPMLRKRIDLESRTQMIVEGQGRASEWIATNSQCIDLRSSSRQEALSEVEAYYQKHRQTCHDLNGFPWFMTLWLLPQDPQDPGAYQHVVMSRFDALLVDGHGISAFMQQFFSAQPHFPNAQAGLSQSPSPVEQQDDELRQRAKSFWQQQSMSKDASPKLPWLQPLDGIVEAKFERCERVIERSQYRQLCRESAKSHCFINSTLTWAATYSLLSWQQGEALRVGLPIAFPKSEQVWDNQSSFIALEIPRQEQVSVAEQVKRLQGQIAQGVEHRDYSGIDLARDIVGRTGEALPLPVVITNGLGWPQVNKADGMHLQQSCTQTPQIALDIRFTLTQEGDLVLAADYVTQALDTGWVECFLDLCQTILEHLAKPDGECWQQPFCRASLVDPIAPPLPHNANEYDFLGRIAKRLQAKGEETLCYYQNKAYSAHWFYQHVSALMSYWQYSGIRRGDVVAIALPKGPQHLAVIISCALSGLVWVPIDTLSPLSRRRYLLSHCQAKTIVGEGALDGFDIKRFEEIIECGQKQPLSPWPSAQTLARLSHQTVPSYYLYTSGTTGQPKCVVLNNRATANVLGQTLSQWQVTSNDCLLSVTPWHHDMSLFDTLGMMSCGGEIVVPSPEEEKDALAWAALVERYSVSLWCSVPAILEMLLSCAELDSLKGLRLIAQGGDYIKPNVINGLREKFPRMQWYSLGGPTETTVWSIWHQLQPKDVQVIPYGKALAGNNYYILDANLQPCLPYQVGRMYCAGVNLANGYLQQGELVQHDFVELPLANGHTLRAYQTSDQGFVDNDGKIIFAGRLNGYIKVRGVRVSLPDIEKSLMETNRFVDLVALPLTRNDGDTEIGVAFIGRDADLKQSQARQIAGQVLPVSHHPRVWLKCERFPLSANGKVDRRELTRRIEQATWQSHPTTSLCEKEHATASERELDRVARQLIALYQQVSQRKSMTCRQTMSLIHTGVQANDLIDIQQKIHQQFGQKVPMTVLISCRYAHDLAKRLVTISRT